MANELVIMPTFTDTPWYKYKIVLSQVLYTLHFRFNSRMDRWIMDISDAINNDILTSIPLLINHNVTGRFSITNLPPGYFFCLDDTNQDTQPTQFSFGPTHTLWYSDPTGTT